MCMWHTAARNAFTVISSVPESVLQTGPDMSMRFARNLNIEKRKWRGPSEPYISEGARLPLCQQLNFHAYAPS